MHDTEVADLSPLSGLPLASLNAFNTRVTDLSPLAGLPLQVLTFTPAKVTRGIDAIRKMTSIQKIGDGGPLLSAAEFWKKYDAGDFGNPAGALGDPAFQKWVQEVAALSAEKQVETVVAKLKALNPGFDGKVNHKIEGNVVTELDFLTDQVTDISPVRALKSLAAFSCAGSKPGQGKLADLSPLQGLPIEDLGCYWTEVRDLSPLKGMPLKVLACDAAVSSLAPLAGMPLSVLHCGRSAVSDLAPLRGMALTELWIAGSEVTDLTPLEGMPLSRFRFTPAKITRGMALLRQMKSLSRIEIGKESKEQFVPAEFWKRYDAGEFGTPVSNGPIP